MESAAQGSGESRCNNAMGLQHEYSVETAGGLRCMVGGEALYAAQSQSEDREYCFNYAWALEKTGRRRKLSAYTERRPGIMAIGARA